MEKIKFAEWAEEGQKKGYLERFLNSTKRRKFNSYREWLEVGKKQGFIPKLTNEMENRFEDYLSKGDRQSRYQHLSKKEQKQFRTAYYNTAFSKNPAGLTKFIALKSKPGFNFSAYLDDRIRYAQGFATTAYLEAWVIEPLLAEAAYYGDSFIDAQVNEIVRYCQTERIRWSIAKAVGELLYDETTPFQVRIDKAKELLGLS